MATWPGSHNQQWWDVTLKCPLKVIAKADKIPGKAAADAERSKHKRYGPDVAPLALETFGRMGPESQQLLAPQAREATLYGTVYSQPSGSLLRRWRADGLQG